MARKKSGKNKGSRARHRKGLKETPTRVRVRKAPTIDVDAERESLSAGLAEMGSAAHRLLIVLADPDAWGKTNLQRMELASVSKAHFYRLMKDADFLRRARDAMLLGLRGGISGPLEALYKTASKVGREGHQDRKLLLEMTGMYSPAKRNEQAATDQGDDLPDDELVWLWLASNMPMERWTPAVRERYQRGQIVPRKPQGVPGPATAAPNQEPA